MACVSWSTRSCLTAPGWSSPPPFAHTGNFVRPLRGESQFTRGLELAASYVGQGIILVAFAVIEALLAERPRTRMEHGRSPLLRRAKAEHPEVSVSAEWGVPKAFANRTSER